MIIPTDFPKIQCPFVRKDIDGKYVVTPEINPECSWVFTDEGVTAVEKLDGTCVSVVIEGGMITSIWNRDARIPFFSKGTRRIVDGVLNSYEKGLCDLPDGQWFGELIGPGIQSNPYNLKEPMWIPFKTFVDRQLKYKSFGNYPKTFEGFEEWMKTLIPLFNWRTNGQDSHYQFVEGVIFQHPDGRLAKLRKDQYPWFEGKRHKEE
jgi:hypothetical protein